MRKVDEMDLYIISKANKNTYMFSSLFLLFWLMYDLFNKIINNGKSLPLLLLSLQVLINVDTTLHLNKKMSKNE